MTCEVILVVPMMPRSTNWRLRYSAMCGLGGMDNYVVRVFGDPAGWLPLLGLLEVSRSRFPIALLHLVTICPMELKVLEHACSGTDSRSYHAPRAVLHAHAGVVRPASYPLSCNLTRVATRARREHNGCVVEIAGRIGLWRFRMLEASPRAWY